MAQQTFYATGKRKTAIARVWLTAGDGKITVNQMSTGDYFGNAPETEYKIGTPFKLTDTLAQFDVKATLKGGGKSAQGEALRHGISKALLEIDPAHRGNLKKAGLLTRDPRAKERKKYGQKGARARFQFSKR